ncbi:MAG: SpoIID/LytB domain-containing protein [Candidatus Pacebacteria bacterium]|nr:SpoIID/LytB domain-containing protein [Candidatus Paceibacterota bacterium]
MKKVWCLLAVVLLICLISGRVILPGRNYSVSWSNLIQVARAIDPVDDLQTEINELNKLLQMSEQATENLEASVADINSRIKSAQAGINSAQTQAKELSADIDQREEDLAVQYKIFQERIAQQYKRSRTFSPFMLIFSTASASELTKDLMYNSNLQAQDNHLIRSISGEISQLQQDKQNLEATQDRLASLQKQLNEQKESFQKDIEGAREYQETLETKIAELSAKQQAIINARSGTYTTSVGEVPLADDFNASIGFKPQAPSNSFAVFSFGGYTHRNGMSQYGAKARADAGQSVEDILKAYYPGSQLKKDYPVMGSITVDGVGAISFEDHYLQGIYEMPASWHLNALKAQAIAARTYAVRYTNNGQKSICATESCQVFKNSKKGGDWEKAVNETKGWVLVDGAGSPVSTQYASTHGGYSNTSGWDLDGGYDSSSWTTRAWEKKADSPWFYKSWYRSGYSSSAASCGRSHPWLSQTEFADIINAWLVRRDPRGADTNRIQPVTINECQIGGQGGNPYSMDELRDWANKSGGAVTNISGVTVSHNSNGQTTSVSLNTNRGTINIPGSEFKQIFNLRAPGYLRIPQSSFAFFNVEYKI